MEAMVSILLYSPNEHCEVGSNRLTAGLVVRYRWSGPSVGAIDGGPQ